MVDEQHYIFHPTTWFQMNRAYQVKQNLEQYDASLLKPITALGNTWIAQHDRPYETKNVKVGMQVTKEGRTTGKTLGICIAKNVTILVDYGVKSILCRGVDMFEGVQNKPFSKKGDSGSAIWEDKTDNVVSLLFAGSNDAKITYGYPIQPILRKLNIW